MTLDEMTADRDNSNRLLGECRRVCAERSDEIERLRGALWVAAERLEARGHNFGAADARRAADAPSAPPDRSEQLPGKGNGGGPTVAEPDRPYCKDDQSCCDFTCGN